MNKELTIDILSSVAKPARYPGDEFGSIVKTPEETEVNIALAFPDVYEIGMSYLGFKILYHIVNKERGLAAERVCAPWTDMEAKMREHGIPLRSLETNKVLKDFDFVGFTLQYELSYSNILNMLDLGQVPVLAAERSEADPFVVVGGPCVYNPEPLADVFDMAVIGEGEEVLVELLNAYREWKKQGRSGGRRGFLERAVKIKGIYVPSFYKTEYNEDNTVKAVVTTYEGAPAVIEKRVIKDLNDVDFPTAPVVPFGEIVHARIMLEVFRGCTRGCRFCHAGMVYRPVRERHPEVLKALARKLVDNTGYNEISLVSLSTADYTCLAPMIHDMIAEFKAERVSVSLPSLRIDSFSVDLAKEVQAVRKSGLTFAPEAGTQRLRDAINKGVSEDDLLRAVGDAFSSGWNGVKLYFMIGLPTETEEDILGIAELARKVSALFYSMPKEKRGKGLRLSVSASSFVPKPFTPFQWEPQDRKETLIEKQKLLKSALKGIRGVEFSYHEPDISVLEAVFARGDRKLADVLERAWELGARFDSWDEHFKLDAWNAAFEQTGVDPDA